MLFFFDIHDHINGASQMVQPNCGCQWIIIQGFNRISVDYDDIQIKSHNYLVWKSLF